MSFLFEGRWIGRGLSAQTIPPNVQRGRRFPSLKPDYYLLIDLFVSRPNAQQKKKYTELLKAAPPTAKEWQRVREGGRRLRRWARVKPKTEEAAGIQFWPCGSGCSGGGGGGSSSQAYVTSDPYPAGTLQAFQQTWNIQLFMPQSSFFSKICWVQLARPPGDSGKLLRGENSFRSGSIRRTNSRVPAVGL